MKKLYIVTAFLLLSAGYFIYSLSLTTQKSASSLITPEKVKDSHQSKINVGFKGKKVDNILVGSSSQSRLVNSTALEAFANCDSILRMIVNNNRLNSLRDKDFVELRLEPAQRIKVAYGGGKEFLISRIFIPLSDRQTSPQWEFYSFGESQEWFALRWTKPDVKVLKKLKQASQKLVEI